MKSALKKTGEFDLIGATREEIERVLRLPEPPMPQAGDVSDCGGFVYDGQAWRLLSAPVLAALEVREC